MEPYVQAILPLLAVMGLFFYAFLMKKEGRDFLFLLFLLAGINMAEKAIFYTGVLVSGPEKIYSFVTRWEVTVFMTLPLIIALLVTIATHYLLPRAEKEGARK